MVKKLKSDLKVLHYFFNKKKYFLFDSQMKILYIIQSVHPSLIESAELISVVMPGGYAREGGKAAMKSLHLPMK